MLVMVMVDLQVRHLEGGDPKDETWILKRGAVAQVHPDDDGDLWCSFWLYNDDTLVNKTIYSGESLVRVPIEHLKECELLKVECMFAFPVDEDKAQKVAHRAGSFRFEAGQLVLAGETYRADMTLLRKRDGGWVKSSS